MASHNEIQERSASPPPACDAWASIAAANCLQPPPPGSVREQVARNTQQLQEQNLLGSLTFETLSQRFDQIDQGGNSDGIIQRRELTTFIERQNRMPEAARDRNAILGVQQALTAMTANGREFLTRDDVNAGLKDGLLPEARDMGAAAKQFDAIVRTMRHLYPDSVANGNQVNVGMLRQALTDHREDFSRNQQAAITTLLSDAYNVANSIGPVNRALNWLWNGNDGRYISPESIAERSQQLGNPVAIRLPINHRFARTL